MKTETMTVHEALSEIKVASKRVTATLLDMNVVTANRKNATKINGIEPEKFNAQAKADFQSVTDLWKRLTAMKAAIATYNASQRITVGDKEYTIAEAIYMKEYGMPLKQTIVNTLNKQYQRAVDKVTTENSDSRLGATAERLATASFGSKDKADAVEMERFITTYKENNQFVLIDPVNVKAVITELQSEIDTFEAKVDSAIQIANATNTITIEY